MAQTSGKKVVHAEQTATEKEAAQAAAAGMPGGWTASPEAKSQATLRRVFAVILWVLAIGAEAFGIFWLLPTYNKAVTNPIYQSNPKWDWLRDNFTVILIALLVVMAVFAIGGSLLWKAANRLDPASKSNPTRFFIQNQLGGIITIIAFVPLIILIFLDKNMSGQQKGIAGGVGIVLLVVAGLLGVSFNPPSVEGNAAASGVPVPAEITNDPATIAATQQVVAITGKDDVTWTKEGEVYHLCSAASAVNHQSQDNQIYEGTVAEAIASGKSRLTEQVTQEEKECGFTPAATN